MDQTQPLTESHDLIKDAGGETWEKFERLVEMMRPEDLDAVADRLGCARQQDWEDYAKMFSDYEWYQFDEAYHHVTYRDLATELGL